MGDPARLKWLGSLDSVIRAFLLALCLLASRLYGAVPVPWIGMQGEWLLSPQAEVSRWAWLAEVDAMGVTEITMTVIGGDVPGIDIRTAGRTERQGWSEFKDAANALGITPVVYLSEWEHRGVLSDADRLDIAAKAVYTFGYSGWIACIGEEFWAGPGTAQAVADQVRAMAPGIPVAWHNPHEGVPRIEFEWLVLPRALPGDIWLIQDTLAAMPATYARAEALGLIAVAHEQVPAGPGTQPSGVSAWFADGRRASIYPGYDNPDCTDLRCPRPGVYAQPLAQLGRERFLRPSGIGGDKNSDGRIDAADYFH
jgi:hypothetical protein